MSVALYMDENVPAAISSGLRSRGVDVVTAQEDRMDGRPDPVLLDRAGLLGRVLFTRDEDFLEIAAVRQRNGITFAGIVYAHQLRVSLNTCIDALELIAKAGEREDFNDQLIYLPL